MRNSRTREWNKVNPSVPPFSSTGIYEFERVHTGLDGIHRDTDKKERKKKLSVKSLPRADRQGGTQKGVKG